MSDFWCHFLHYPVHYTNLSLRWHFSIMPTLQCPTSVVISPLLTTLQCPTFEMPILQHFKHYSAQRLTSFLHYFQHYSTLSQRCYFYITSNTTVPYVRDDIFSLPAIMKCPKLRCYFFITCNITVTYVWCHYLSIICSPTVSIWSMFSLFSIIKCPKFNGFPSLSPKLQKCFLTSFPWSS